MTLVIKNGTVIDPISKTEEKKDILIEKGIIKKIGNRINTDGEKVIDAAGQYVMPGIYRSPCTSAGSGTGI